MSKQALWPASRVADHVLSFRPGPRKRKTRRKPKMEAPRVVREACLEWVPADELKLGAGGVGVVLCETCRAGW